MTHLQPHAPAAWLGPATHVFFLLGFPDIKTWMPGPSPGKGSLVVPVTVFQI